MKNKIITKILGITAGICMLSSLSTMASDDSYGFTLTVKVRQYNSSTVDHYRQTDNVANPWKVRIFQSGEGRDTITVCWLEKGQQNVSPDVYVQEGHAAYYSSPYEEANKSNVHMSIENNNYNNHSYTVSGDWDEETW